MNHNLNIKFEYEFFNKGTVITDEGDLFCIQDLEISRISKENRLFLDIGGCLSDGIIDHHFRENDDVTMKSSAASRVIQYPEKVTAFIEENTDTVIIGIHSDPDFDSIASAYLAQEFIRTGRFSDNAHLLVEYANQVDAGKLSVSMDNIKQPHVLFYGFDEYIKKQAKLNGEYNLSQIEKTKRVMDHGIAYVQYLMDRLNELVSSGKGFFDRNFFPDDSPYEEEFNILVNDYSCYISERDDPEICEKRKIKLPKTGSYKLEYVEVDALLWKTYTKSILHKAWAREDEAAPLGKGFICTFIPTMSFDETHEKVISKLQTKVLTISVKPDCSVSLEGLGQMLEKKESLKERNLLHETDRRSGTPRYHEVWCTNNDPWYPGYGHNSEIIETPRRGSLLTIQEIYNEFIAYLNEFEDYLKPDIRNFYVKYVFPFNFNYDKRTYCNLLKHFEASGLNPCPDATKNGYFHDYIYDFLFCGEDNAGNENLSTRRKSNRLRQKNKKQSRCRHFQLNHYLSIEYDDIEGLKLTYPEYEDCKESALTDPCVRTSSKGFFSNLGECKNLRGQITLFQYGIGFLIIEGRFPSVNNIRFEKLLQVNQNICKDASKEKTALEIKKHFLCGDKILMDMINLEEGLVFSAIELTSIALGKDRNRKEMLYKYANLLDWKVPYTQSEYMDTQLKQMILEIGDYASFCFSKSGCVMIAGTKDNEYVYAKMKQTWDDFINNDFYTFLMSLQQRYSLLGFSKKLADYDRFNNLIKLGELRTSLMDFMAQGWFSQITNNELGMSFYDRMSKIFQNQILYEEVFKQITAMDEYKRAKNAKAYQVFTFVMYPVLVINALIALNLFEKPEILIKGFASYQFNWIILFAFIVGFALMIQLAFKRRK